MKPSSAGADAQRTKEQLLCTVERLGRGWGLGLNATTEHAVQLSGLEPKARCDMQQNSQPLLQDRTWLDATMAATMAAAISPARIAEVAFSVPRTGTWHEQRQPSSMLAQEGLHAAGKIPGES